MLSSITTNLLFLFTLLDVLKASPMIAPRKTSYSPGPVLPYGNNLDGHSLMQCYSQGNWDDPTLYTQLSNEAWTQWLAIPSNALIKKTTLPSSDKRCNGGIFQCLSMDQSTTTTASGSTIQASTAVNCGSVSVCTASSTVALQVGVDSSWQNSFGNTVNWLLVKVYAATQSTTRSWTSKTTDSTTATCGGSTGDTICLAYTPLFYQSQMSCTLRGITQASYTRRDKAPTESWICPSTPMITANLEVLDVTGRGAGEYTCIKGIAACASGFGNVIDARLITPSNSRKVVKGH